MCILPTPSPNGVFAPRRYRQCFALPLLLVAATLPSPSQGVLRPPGTPRYATVPCVRWWASTGYVANGCISCRGCNATRKCRTQNKE